MTFFPQRGVVAPTPAATALHPLPCGAVRLTPGFWWERQRINRERSIPHGMEEIRKAGGFDNFRHVADGVGGQHGHAHAIDGDVKNFVDSDVYKWLEAVGWEGVRGPLSDAVEAQAEEAIDLILRAQDDDGYLNTWYQTQPRCSRFSDMAFGHELYCLGHLIQASLAYSRARGDDRLLGAARRFADLAVATFGAGRREQVCGHPEIEMALVELSRETGEPRYAELARLLIDRRGHGLLGPGRFGAAYYQDRLPYREMTTVEGHAVRALYLCCGAADVGVQSGDESLVAAARRQWQAMVANKMYLTGGIGSRHLGESFGDAFELPPDRAYCETCAAVAVVMGGWRLLLAECDGSIADVIERALYNGVLAGVSQDGCSFHYTNPLQVRSEHSRQPWFEIACCPPNTMRTLASIEQYIATESEDGVQLHQYAAADIAAAGRRSLRVETAYPLDGQIRVVITDTADEAWSLALRIPAWADNAELSVNGQPWKTEERDGYLEVNRKWQVDDEILLNLQMMPRLTEAFGIDAVRGSVAVERGPLVFCVEEVDLPIGLSLSDLQVGASSMPSEMANKQGPFGLQIGLVANASDAAAADWPYRSPNIAADMHGAPTTLLKMVPYYAWGNRGPGGMRVWLPLARDRR